VIYSLVILAVGALYLLYYSSDFYFLETGVLALTLGSLNLAFGMLTAKSGGVAISSDTRDPVKMVVDRGVVGSTIYVLVFSDKKVVLKKLTSGSVTILAVIAFALAGLLLANYIGAALGGITAFSLQEFLTQRRRNATKKGNLLSVSRGDLAFEYDDMKRMELTKSRLRLYLQNGIMGIVISRKQSATMLPVLEKVAPSLFREKRLVASRNASEKKNH
jgi:hypothetical protein